MTDSLWSRLKPAAREFRRNSTDAEDLLWQRLRGSQLGARFRRQHAIDPFIVDFYCASAKLVIEVDGGIHNSMVDRDLNRQANLEQRGLIVLRFTNDEVLTDIDSVLARISETLARLGAE